MPLIKTITSGDTVKVVTKDGKPSCTCCNACSCSEDLPDTYTIDLDFFPFTGPITVTRESPCVWRWTDMSISDVTLKCISIGWEVQWESEGSTGPWYQDTPTPADPTGIYGGGEATVS